jgi:predicted Zn-dependent protease with MMP-like domain
MTFRQLKHIAEDVVGAAQRRLPPELRRLAQTVPVCYESYPSDEILEGGDLEPDILGLFVGHEHLSEHLEGAPLPPQILLFVDNIWDYAEGEERTYRDEIRLTYLHELGHYLGWDEEEVARRGLE